jgi:transposase
VRSGRKRASSAGFVPVAITGCGGELSSREEQAAIEIEVGAVRIRVRGTVDRRALCEVLAAVGTVGR